MTRKNRRSEIRGHATALDIYAQRKDLASIRKTSHLMIRLFDEQEQELEALEQEKLKLQGRVSKLRHTNELAIGYYESSLSAFERFRNGISIIQSMRTFNELPEVLERIRILLELSDVGLVLAQEEYKEFVPQEVPTCAYVDLERLAAQLLLLDSKHEAFLGAVGEVQDKGYDLGLRNVAEAQRDSGSCFVKILRDKFDPRRIVGVLTFVDHGEERYTRDKATDFLEHFCDVLAWSVVTVRNHERLDRERVIDPLTGAHNRAYLNRHAPRILDFADRKGFPVCLLFMDLNGFKAINDSLGHEAGDQVLIEVARRMKETVRGYDIFVRMGGDEFVVLMPDTDETNARSLAERIEGIFKDFSVAGCTGRDTTLSTSTAMGLCVRKSGQSLDELLEEADQAMYQDKNRRKGIRNAQNY